MGVVRERKQPISSSFSPGILEQRKNEKSEIKAGLLHLKKVEMLS